MSGFSKLNETMAVQEAADAGLNSMARLIEAFSHQQPPPCQNQKPDCREIANFTVSKFKRVISLLDRTGHARFRRGPVQPRPYSPALGRVQHHNPPLSLFSPPASAAAIPYGLIQPQNPASKIYRPQPQSLRSLSPASTTAQAPAAAQPLTFGSNKPSAPFKKYGSASAAGTTSENKSSKTFRSSVTGERSVSNRRGRLPIMCAGLSVQPLSVSKPPLPGRRSREDDRSDAVHGQTSGSRPCKSKRRVRKIIKVPAISSNNKDIPPDQYSWRKYGEREIKGSPYPRCYYKCRMMKDWTCPARKYVERDIDDPRMLFVIYEGEHRHNQAAGADDLDPMVVID
ncbi:hypothetical protein CDL12_23273 [Handroanthus impetiginosus]|uniref:WRKY domain-containing protein n=1 Tax=Handroanthus impetiginosus TaxID=429701 RepID=A0A2G9GFZ8_9LAMI|nr:hypothetical protein CDL12_23273 [Handroanthus impetiginosus]